MFKPIKISTLKYLLFFLVFATVSSCSLNPKIEIDKTKRINNIVAADIVNSLENAGFYYRNNNDYLSFLHSDYRYLEIKVYSNNSLSSPNGVLVFVLITNETENPNTSIRYKEPINDKYFNIIKQGLSSLPCNSHRDFLLSGFTCNENYIANYSIHKDPLDNIRTMLGLNKNIQLVIEIKPLNN